MRARGFGGWGLAAFAILTACDSFERTNPLDPSYPLEVAIVGPDTIYSVNDTVQFQIVTEPAHPGLPFAWSTSAATRLQPVANSPGVFTSLANGVAVIRAELGSRTVEKQVVIEQRATRLMILPPPATQLSSLGEVLQLTAAIVDAKNTPVQGASADLQWVSSNPGVVEVVNGRATARANGVSWVKATSLGQADSIRVAVQQVPVTLQFGSANYTITIPGGAVQTVITARDARNVVIDSPSGLTLTTSRNSFQVSPTGLVQSTGFGSTQVRARLGELEAFTNVRVTGGTAPVVNQVTARLVAAPESGRDLVIQLDVRDAELDLDEATVEVYSSTGIWMATRVVPLQQGVANQVATITIPNAAGAGTVRVRLRDAANNNSSLTTWPVAAG